MNIYWKIGVMVAIFLAGWHSHTIYEGYQNEKRAEAEVKAAHLAENNIIKFNQNFTKELKHETSPCLNQPIPAGISKLLK